MSTDERGCGEPQAWEEFGVDAKQTVAAHINPKEKGRSGDRYRLTVCFFSPSPPDMTSALASKTPRGLLRSIGQRHFAQVATTPLPHQNAGRGAAVRTEPFLLEDVSKGKTQAEIEALPQFTLSRKSGFLPRQDPLVELPSQFEIGRAHV